MEENFIKYLENLAIEHNRIFNTDYTAVFLQEEITGEQLHGLETTVTCALLMELRDSLQKEEVK